MTATVLGLVCYDYHKVTRLLRWRFRAQVIAWAGIVPAAVLLYIWTVIAEKEEQVARRTVLESLTVLVSLLMPMLATVLVIGIVYTQLEDVETTMLGIVPTIILAVVVAGIGAWFKAIAEEILVRTESAGMAVSGAGILALALTVAKAGTDNLPLLFGITIAVVIAMTGTWGLALGDALREQSPVVMTLVIPVIGVLALSLIDFTERLSFVTGMTALHYAAWYDHITCGSYLVEAGANMKTENRYLRTPLHICSRRFRAAVQQAHSHQPQQVIAVIGNTEYGKSTLIAALQSESRTL